MVTHVDFVGVQRYQTEWPPETPAWLGSPACFVALAFNAMITLHINRRAGHNAHHVAEACFKALARALRMAVETDPRSPDAVPSTKGVLEA